MKKSLIPVSCLIAAVMASGLLPARVNAAGVPESAALTVRKIMTVETTPAGNEEDAQEAEVRTSNGRLRVRKGAGTQYEILTYLHDGDKVPVLSVDGEWAKVATDAGDGYVSTSFLKMEETSSRESAPDQAESGSSSTAETEEEKPAPEDNTEETPAEQNPEGTGTATVRTSGNTCGTEP